MTFTGKIIPCDSWRNFREKLDGFFTLSAERRRQLWFRGQAKIVWPLQPTLDRGCNKPLPDSERDALNRQLTGEFRENAIRLGLASDLPADGSQELELLARHHGLPSPYLDWSTSPFIASYFAISGAIRHQSNQAAIWCLDRDLVDDGRIELLDSIELLSANRRALAQRGVFLRTDTAQEAVESILKPALTRFDVNTGDAEYAIAEFEDMTINAGYLLNDLEGVAEAVWTRNRKINWD